MTEQTNEQIEQVAQNIWSRRLIQTDIAKIAHRYGFTQGEIDFLEYDMLPEAVQGHIRELAEQEIASGEKQTHD